MSNDILTNQMKTDAVVTPKVSQATQVNSVDGNSEEINSGNVRQKLPVNTGKLLPSENETQAISSEALKKAVVDINKELQAVERDLMFKVDEDSGRTIVSVFNTQTEELVRQIPTEDVLRISKNIQEQLNDSDNVGIILETSA